MNGDATVASPFMATGRGSSERSEHVRNLHNGVLLPAAMVVSCNNLPSKPAPVRGKPENPSRNQSAPGQQVAVDLREQSDQRSLRAAQLPGYAPRRGRYTPG